MSWSCENQAVDEQWQAVILADSLDAIPEAKLSVSCDFADRSVGQSMCLIFFGVALIAILSPTPVDARYMPVVFARKHGLKPFSGANNFTAREAFLRDEDMGLSRNVTVFIGNPRMYPD
jgi:hypothetical protein